MRCGPGEGLLFFILWGRSGSKGLIMIAITRSFRAYEASRAFEFRRGEALGSQCMRISLLRLGGLWSGRVCHVQCPCDEASRTSSRLFTCSGLLFGNDVHPSAQVFLPTTATYLQPLTWPQKPQRPL